MKHVLLAGGTGMIGGILLDLCIASQQVSQVTHLTRKASGRSHPKLLEHTDIDFNDLSSTNEYYKNIDVVFFCIGVYTGAVPRNQFKKITVEFPVNLATKIKQHAPTACFCFLSGSGADRKEKSKLAFAKDKGIAENKLSALGLNSFHAFRPAYIYPVTPRKEPNISYRLSRVLYPLIRLFGKNSSIKSTELAQAMFNVGMGAKAAEVLENAAIVNLSSS